jgi:hypothetical protein
LVELSSGQAMMSAGKEVHGDGIVPTAASTEAGRTGAVAAAGRTAMGAGESGHDVGRLEVRCNSVLHAEWEKER